ncbi:unnamed protein product [marine sediment metagenome]|uniref:Uncharacterized protein n=1 Tax=marine sediment metagenome TaxID=412755 RepID=X1P1S5_9ZZZZ
MGESLVVKLLLLKNKKLITWHFFLFLEVSLGAILSVPSFNLINNVTKYDSECIIEIWKSY